MEQEHDYLRRLPSAAYQGDAFVHWSMTIEDRKTGWLIPIFYYKFREVLTHAAFRYGFCCPMYCCMPDHIHLLLLGVRPKCDQRSAVRFLRMQLNVPLERLGARLQKQPYDHVLREGERQGAAFEAVAEYIARNPERAGLVKVNDYKAYPYTNCLMPGYPDMSPWSENYWENFWSLYSQMKKTGLFEVE